MLATSKTHPLRIDSVQVPDGTGLIGMTLCPGKSQHSGGSATWARDLEADLDAIDRWGARLVVSLLDDAEFMRLQVPHLGKRVEARGLDWWHLPIFDGNAPGQSFRNAWPERSVALLKRLRTGENVLLHCRGGLGRTGTVAARVLIDGGMTADQAISVVRAARPGAIENTAQETYLRESARNGGTR